MMFRNYFLLLGLFLAGNVLASDQVWLRVDTRAKVLEVVKAGHTLDSFEHIAIGRGGAGIKEHRGDGITPLGTFRISTINRHSHFRTFFGIDYPSVEIAGKALKDGLLSRPEYNRILHAHQRNKLPPQNTALGGRLGIHGLGHANVKIHREFDWTRGCIALTNPQIDRLARWIKPGMVVKVK